MFRSVVCGALIFIYSCALAQEAKSPGLNQFIGPKTMAFVQYRPKVLLKIPAVQSIYAEIPGGMQKMNQEYQRDLGLLPEDIDALTMFVDVMGPQGPDAPRIQMLMQTSKPINFTTMRKTLGKSLKTVPYGKFEMTIGDQQALVKIDDRTALQLMNIDRKQMEDLLHEPLLPFAQADAVVSEKWNPVLAAHKNQPFFAGSIVPASLRQLASEQLENGPPMLAPFKAMLKLDASYLSMEYVPGQAEDCPFKLVSLFPDAKAAQAGMGAIKFGIASSKMAISNMIKSAEPPRNLENFWAYSASFYMKQLQVIKIEQQVNQVVINYPMKSQEILPVMQLAVEKVRLAADRMLSAANMRQLMIAMHNYHNDYNSLPEPMTMKAGKPLHSWRVQLLPYLGQAELHRKLRLDEPWDSPHNKQVFEAAPMPKVFEHPYKLDGASRKTYYQVFYSKSDAKSPATLRLGIRPTLGQLTVNDGTSNTIAMIETGNPVLWYQPEDIEFDGAKPFPKLTTPWKMKSVYVAFYDASIRTAKLDGDEAIWKALVTWNGGEMLDVSKVID